MATPPQQPQGDFISQGGSAFLALLARFGVAVVWTSKKFLWLFRERSVAARVGQGLIVGLIASLIGSVFWAIFLFSVWATVAIAQERQAASEAEGDAYQAAHEQVQSELEAARQQAFEAGKSEAQALMATSLGLHPTQLPPPMQQPRTEAPPPPSENGAVEVEDEQPVERPEEVLAHLDRYIGQESVKREFHKLSAVIERDEARRAQGFDNVSPAYHLAFTGPPGTGKTEFARIYGRLLRAHGVLAKGHTVECDRSGLVKGYVGHTEEATTKMIDKALDGVLFIDEAYALARQLGGTEDFGQEAITVLLKRMEDDRRRLVVIAAGYEQEMQHFLDANPGLRSRVSEVIRFEDYGTEELVNIADKFAEEAGYQWSEEASVELGAVIEQLRQRAGKKFGNGRDIRKLFASAVRGHAVRYRDNPEATNLSELTVTDLEVAKERYLAGFDDEQAVETSPFAHLLPTV